MKCYVLLALVVAVTEANMSFSNHNDGLQVRRLTRPILIKRNPMFQGSSSGKRQTGSKASSGLQQASDRSSGFGSRGTAKESPKGAGAGHDAVLTAELLGPTRATVTHGNNILRPMSISAKKGESKTHEFTDPHKVMVGIQNGPGGKATLVGTASKGSTTGQPQKGTDAYSVSELHNQAGAYQYAESKNGEISQVKGHSGSRNRHVLVRGGLNGEGQAEMTASNSPVRSRERKSY